MRIPSVVAALAIVAGAGSNSPVLTQARPPASSTSQGGRGGQAAPFQQRTPDFARMLEQQSETDKTWKAASEGHMRMEKITYRSKTGDLDIPAFVFQPLQTRGPKSHPA